MLRVAQPDAPVILKLAAHGSFGEFFSFYWEALHETGMDHAVWAALEELINERANLIRRRTYGSAFGNAQRRDLH